MPDLVIEWDGKDYRIKEDAMFELIEAIERHITLPELMMMLAGGKPNFSALARPFHEMLKHAGVRNPPSLLKLRRMLVHEGLSSLEAQSKGDAPLQGAAMAAISTMTEILMDGAPDMAGGDDKPKKTKPRSRKAAIKSRSANGA